MASTVLGIRSLSVVLVATQLASCALAGMVKDGAKVAGGCPDTSSIEAIAKIDFADEYSFDAGSAAKVKAGVIAASNLQSLAKSLDGDLKVACSGLAKDLSGKGDFKSGSEACKAAGSAIAQAKTDLGAGATVSLDVKPPKCAASLDAMADCAAKCDASVKPGEAEVKCEGGELSGVCEAECKGTCELTAAATCGGTCEGSCDASFSGSCGGACNGTCDGKSSHGSCAGKCEGTCDADAKGSCGGSCTGSCEMEAGATCAGTCTGECSVALKEPKCSGKLVPPTMSAECQASCDAHASANVECTKPKIAVAITGAANAEAAAKYKAALEAHMPGILKVAVGMGPKVVDLMLSGKTTIEGGIAAGQAVAKARPSASVHVMQCLVEPFQGAITAVGNIEASVNVSVELNASASGAASATASSESPSRL